MAKKPFISVDGITVGEANALVNVILSNGDITTSNITIGNNANLGNVGNIIITGGSSGYVLSTNGSGNLSWIAQSGGGSTSNISNGNSNVNIATENGNITMSAVGNANIVVVTGTGANITGTLNVTGNATVGNIITGAGSGGNITGANVISANTVTASGNITAGNANLGNAVTANFFIGSGANLTSIAGANVSGQVGNALVASTVYTNAQPNITSVGTLTSLSVSGTGSFGANVNLNSFNITNLATPVASTDAATKQYVDDVAQGLNVHDSVQAATPTTLASITGGTITYNNGSSGVGANLTTTGSFNLIDGVNVQTSGTRILVKNEANAVFNGIYTWSNATVITRAVDYNTVPEVEAGDFVFCTGGTLYDNTGWVQTSTVTAIGTTGNNIEFTQFSGAGTYQAGTGLTLTGSTFSVNASQTQVTSVGTLGNLTVSGNATVGNLVTSGSGGTLSNINVVSANTFTASGNITAGNANLGNSVTANFFTGNLYGTANLATFATTANAVAGSNVSGQVGNALVAGTVYTAAQPNITSVGTLTGLTSTGTVNLTGASNVSLGPVGNVKITGGSNGQYLQTDGTGTLNWVSISSSATLANGNSNVNIPAANGNINLTAVGNTVMVVTGTGVNVAGTLNISGNTTVSNLISSGTGGNISNANVISANTFIASGNITATNINTTGSGGNIGNANVISANTFIASGNITAGNANLGNATTANYFIGNFYGTANSATTAGTVTTAAQPNITSVGTLSSLSVTGNISSGNANLGNLVTANFFSGNGSLLTGITVSAGNSIVNGNSNVSIPVANGNVNISAVGNANVLVITGTGANITGTANISGNLSVGNIVTSGSGGNITGGNVISANTFIASGNITASNANLGNAVTANYFIGNLYGTANLATFATTANSVAGGNVSGQVGNALVASTVYTNAQPNITSVGTLTSLSVSGTGLFGANVNLNSFNITNLATPVASTDAATKQYVDDVAQGLNIHDAVAAATPTTLASITGGTITYNNGSSGVGANLTTTGTFNLIDGVNVQTSGTRILVKNEANAVFNGIYTWSNATVITRATDYNTVPEVEAGDFVFCTGGTLYDNTGWVQTSTVTAIGTAGNNIEFTQFSGAGTYTAGTGLTLTGSVFSISNTTVTAGSYGNGDRVATFTVNSQGQLTAAANTAITANAANLTGTTLATGIVTSSLTSVGNLIGLTVSNSSSTVNFSNTANVTLGTVSNLHISGGTNAYVLSTDGAGNLSWVAQTAGGGSNISNGNSNVSIATANGNITFSAVGNANVMTITGTGANITGYTTITGNLSAGNITTGAGTGGNISGANVISANIVNATLSANLGNSVTANYFIGNFYGTANSATTAGTVTTAAQPNITSVGTLTSLAVTGNASAGNLNTAGAVVASTLTSNVATGTAPITVTSTTRVSNLNVAYANVADNINVSAGTGNNFLIFANAATGNIAELTSTGLTANLSNNSITATTFVGTLSGAATSATTAGTVTTNAQPNITSVGTLTGLTSTGTINLTSASNVSLGPVGNVKITGGSNGQYLQTDGSGTLTWATVSSGSTSNISNGNSNVNIASANGNITMSAVGNANIVTVTGTGINVAGTLNTTGNVTLSGSNVSLGAVGNVKITGGSNTYVLSTDGAGNLSWVAPPAGANVTVDNFTGNGVQTVFTLSTTPTGINQTSVNYNGATVLRTDYTLANANITFSSAPANGSYIEVTTINLTTSGGGGGASSAAAVGYSLIFGG